MAKALRSGPSTAITLDAAMADQLGIGAWQYRADDGCMTVAGCLAMHLRGIDRVDLQLDGLLDRFSGEVATEFAALLRQGMRIDGLTARIRGHNGDDAWFRFVGNDAAGGFAQRLIGIPTASPESGNAHQRLLHELEERLAQKKASGGQATTVLLFVKIDQLALLEQSREHGPSLAETIMQRLERLPHASAGYRVENDIMAVVFAHCSRLRASDCVRWTRVALRAPVGGAGHDHVLTTTIGAAAHPRHAATAETLYQRAEIALAYAQKLDRHGRHVVFNHRIASELADRLALENELRQALARNELELRYQPIIDLEHRRVGAVEALMRWQHPTRGAVPPAIFIPLAEQLGLIQPLTEWLIRRAGSELQALLEKHPHLRVNINLSARQATPELVRALLRQFAEGAALGADRVTFEVTEGALLENVAPALDSLDELKAKGCRIALDDFGTGFSSISYLEQFPIDCIKIDKGFIGRVNASADSRKLVEAMLFMAGALELDCVAEGVEGIEELAFLAAKGCRNIQGYLFAKPLTAAELPNFLETFRFPEEALAETLWPKAKGLPRLLSDNQEEALKLFVKHVPLAVAMFDADMRYLAASDRWIKDYGIADEAIVGRCHYEILPATPPKWREGHARILATGTVERSPVDSYRHASGHLDWLRWEARPFHNSFGDVAGVIIFSEFITDRVEAEARRRDSEEKLADYLATASDWFWETDTNHRIGYDSTIDAARDPLAESPVGRTHWELAGVRRPRANKIWSDHLATLQAHRPFRDFRYNLTIGGGRNIHVEISGKPVFDAQGHFKGYRGTGRNITARVEAEQELIRQSEQLTFAGHLAGIGYWRTDLWRHEVDWSPEIYRIIDRDPGSFQPNVANRFEIFHPADRGKAMTAILRAAEDGSELHYEARVRRPDGTLRFIVCHGRPEFEKSGRLRGFFGIFQDITEHRQALIAAEHQAEQLALASEIAGIGYWTHDCATAATFWSEEIYRITGWAPDSVTPEFAPGFGILQPADDTATNWTEHRTVWRDAVSKGADFEHRLRFERPDGTVRHALIKARGRHDASDHLTGYFGIVHDITEQVETATTIAARNRENELYRAMIDILPDFIFAKDLDGHFLAANAATATVMGATAQADLIGKTDHDFYEPAIADRFRADEAAFLAEGRTTILEQPGRRLDGSAGFLCSLKAPMRDGEGKIKGYVGHGRDITEEKQARAALAESEAHFRQLVDGSLQALVIAQAGQVIFANDSFVRLFGYPDNATALADTAARTARQPAATRRVFADLNARLAAGESIESRQRLEFVRQNGQPITVDSLACDIVWRGQPALQYTIIDITQQARYEAALEAEKTRLVNQADEMTRLAAALARSKLEAETARDMLNDATAVLSDGFALFEPDGRIVSCNPAFAALYGCQPADLTGITIDECVERNVRLDPRKRDEEATRDWIAARLHAHYRADGTPFESPFGDRWFVIRENRTAKGMTALLRSEITHLKAIQDKLERLATIDMLTELANRRHFTEQATRLLQRCASDGIPAAVLMFDIDRFKWINDRYGHAAGDHALVRVADLCRQQLRPDDLIARWGGEEFVVLLPRLSVDDAIIVAERLRQTIASTLVRTGMVDFGFTVSIGLADCTPGETLENLINLADSALYAAKLQGRDRVVLAEAASAAPILRGNDNTPRPALSQTTTPP